LNNTSKQQHQQQQQNTKTSTQSVEKARKVINSNSSVDNNINSGLINSTTNKQINKKDFIQNQITKDNRSVVTGGGTFLVKNINLYSRMTILIIFKVPQVLL
jgi:hypothetical protein